MAAVVLSDNASSDDLDWFSEQFIDQEEGEEEEMGGRQEGEDATVTMATTPGPKEQTRINSPNAASFPDSLVRSSEFSTSDISLRQCSLKFKLHLRLNPS